MLLAVARHPRCYLSRDIFSRVRLQSLYQKKFSNTSDLGTSDVVNDPIRTLVATNCFDVASVIVARLNEKEIGLVVDSFGCAQNRPTRVTKLTTRHKVDVAWVNAWFKSLYKDDSIPYYPVAITPTMGWLEAREAIHTAICSYIKIQNNDAFPFQAEETKLKEKREAEISAYVDEHFSRIPVSTTKALADIIKQCNSELIVEATMKRLLRKSAGLHSPILPELFERMGLPFQTDSVVTACLATQKEFIQVLADAIEACNSTTEWRRQRHALKNSKKKADPHTDAYLVSGSNPSSGSMLDDMQFTTELSLRTRTHKPKPKLIEARRRSLRAEHCLQITLDISEGEIYNDSFDDDYGTGYDDSTISTFDDIAVSQPATASYTDTQTVTETLTKEQIQAQESADWAATPYKVYMENMAPEITDTVLKHALRYCGPVNGVKFMRSYSSSRVSTALSASNPIILSSETLLEKFGIKSEARESKAALANEEKGHSKSYVLPKNPLAVLASVKRRVIKKSIITDEKWDDGAFVLLHDPEAYMKLTGDDMRIFGICVSGNACRVKAVSEMKVIYLEARSCISAYYVKSFLRTVIGETYNFEVSDVWGNNGARRSDCPAHPLILDWDFTSNRVMPVFTLLRFRTHDEAWIAFEKLEVAIKEGAPFCQSWTKTNWYKTVRAKAKELNAINHMLMEDLAEEPLGSYAEYGTEEFMPLAMKDPEDVKSSNFNSASHNDEHETLYSTHDVSVEPLQENVKVVQPKRSRRSKSEMATFMAKKSEVQELKRIANNKFAMIRRAKRSDIYPFQSSTGNAGSPDHYYSDDEMVVVSSDQFGG